MLSNKLNYLPSDRVIPTKQQINLLFKGKTF